MVEKAQQKTKALTSGSKGQQVKAKGELPVEMRTSSIAAISIHPANLPKYNSKDQKRLLDISPNRS